MKSSANTPQVRRPSEFQQPKGGDYDHIQDNNFQKALTSVAMRPEAEGPETMPKKFESVNTTKMNKMAADLVLQSDELHKTQTPNKMMSKSNKNSKRIADTSAALLNRRSGVVSAIDLQQNNMTPQLQSQGKGISTAKRPLQSVGLFEKFGGET